MNLLMIPFSSFIQSMIVEGHNLQDDQVHCARNTSSLLAYIHRTLWQTSYKLHGDACCIKSGAYRSWRQQATAMSVANLAVVSSQIQASTFWASRRNSCTGARVEDLEMLSRLARHQLGSQWNLVDSWNIFTRTITWSLQRCVYI